MKGGRLFRRVLLAAALLPLSSANGQSWPTKPIRVVLAGPPGGIIDVGARAVSAALGAELGQSLVLDHRPGASGMIAAQIAAAAPAEPLPEEEPLAAAERAAAAEAPAEDANAG